MKKWKLIIRYLKYLVVARGKHAAHAPFLFSFITKVLNKKKENESCNAIKELRKSNMSQNKIKKKLDQQSAAYILQGYLDRYGN